MVFLGRRRSSAPRNWRRWRSAAGCTVGDKNTHPLSRGLAADRRRRWYWPRQRDQHLPRHRARRLTRSWPTGATCDFDLARWTRHRHAHQGPGYHQGPGADRSRTPDRRCRSPILRNTSVGCGVFWAPMPWSRVRSSITRSPSGAGQGGQQNRKLDWETSAAERAELAAALADIERKKAANSN